MKKWTFNSIFGKATVTDFENGDIYVEYENGRGELCTGSTFDRNGNYRNNKESYEGRR